MMDNGLFKNAFWYQVANFNNVKTGVTFTPISKHTYVSPVVQIGLSKDY